MANQIYRVCSGQSARRAYGRGSARDWGICLNFPLCTLAPWWRAKTRDGKQRKFKTLASAERARLKLEADGVPSEVAERQP